MLERQHRHLTDWFAIANAPTPTPRCPFNSTRWVLIAGIVLLELATQKFAWEGSSLGQQVRKEGAGASCGP